VQRCKRNWERNPIIAVLLLLAEFILGFIIGYIIRIVKNTTILPILNMVLGNVPSIIIGNTIGLMILSQGIKLVPSILRNTF